MLSGPGSLLAALLLVLAPACATIPSHLTRLWPGGRTGDPVLGLSTEDGVVVLAAPEYAVGDLFEIQFPVGNSVVRDWGRVDRRNDDLAVIQPLTARLAEGRIATRLPEAHETLYLALRDEDDDPVMEPVERWHDGALGDWILVSGHDPDTLARDQAGAGLYVERDDRWEIVGILAGLTAREWGDDEVALGYVDVLEMARILPDHVGYFDHDVRPLRPDFEFGVPLQPGDVQLQPEESPEEPPAAAPGGSPGTTGGR